MKNTKNITKISVGIPAYNEEANIKKLLKTIMQQNIDNNKTILEIIVVSDGSTDNTNKIVGSLKNKKIILIEGEKREGKNTRLNQILKTFKGDVLILLDADVILDNSNVFNAMVDAFKKSQNVGMVGGNVQPLPSKTISEMAFNNYVYSLNFIKSKINNGNNLYSVRGPLLAFSKQFAKKISVPKNIPDDRYAYFACLNLGFKFIYEDLAKVWFKSPQTFTEQINQGERFKNDKNNLYRLIDVKIINKEHFIPLHLKIIGLLLQILRNPVGYACMKYIQIRVNSNKNNNFSDTWKITNSTKNLSI